MSNTERTLRKIGRSFDRNIIRPVYRNVVRPIEKNIFRPIYQNVIRPIAPALKKIGPDIEKGIRGIGAIALPIAAGVFGGPLGAAAALQVSAQTPWLKKGWQDSMRELSNVTGIDYFKENPYKVAGIGSIALGTYGLANMAAGGGNAWAFGAKPTPGVAGYGGGSGLGGTTAAPTASVGTTGTGGLTGITTTPTAAGINVAKSAGIYTGSTIPASSVSGFAAAPAASSGGFLGGPFLTLGNTAGVGGGTAAGIGGGTAAGIGSTIGGAAAKGGIMSGLVSGAKTLAGLGGLGLLAMNIFGSKNPPNTSQYVPYYPEMIMDAGGAGAEQVSNYDAMGGAYGQQWQQYMDQLSSYADQQREFYEQYANPIQKKYLEMVQQGVDPDIASAMAGAEVMQSYDATQQMLARQQSAMGINPSSPLYQAQATDLASQAALGQATARTMARQNAAQQNMAMLGAGAQYATGLGQNVAGLYSNLAGSAAGMAGMYTDAMGLNARLGTDAAIQSAQINAQNVANMNQAMLAYSGQVAQANINAAMQGYQSRLQFNYGLAELGGRIFSNWLFG